MKFSINLATIFKGIFFGVLWSVITLTGDILFFSEEETSIVGSLIFRATASIVMTIGIIVIMLDILDVELVSSSDDDEKNNAKV